VGTKEALHHDKSCKKGNTFNKNVPKRQTFNPYKDPAHKFDKHLSRFTTKKKGTQNLSALLSRPITNSFFQQAKKKKKKKKELTEKAFFV
jgi:hypothetical protein